MTPAATRLFTVLRRHYYCGTGGRLARLMMSMHNGRTRVSFWDDLQQFDDILNPDVLTIIQEFLTGVYKDGDFNPIAEFLIDRCGYLDDVHQEERQKWVFENEPRLRKVYRQQREPAESLENFCQRQWLETEYKTR